MIDLHYWTTAKWSQDHDFPRGETNRLMAYLTTASPRPADDTIPCRFNEKNAIAFSGQDRVPVLRDGDQVVSDSWTIAIYLEDA
jgi:glutathione S-transferase